MLIALIISLIFSGGSQSFLTNPKIKKHIKKYVESKEVKNEIFELIKNYEKEAKKFDKHEKKLGKELDKMNSSRTTSRVEFEEFFSDYLDSKKPLQDLAITSGLQTRNLISDSEWELIINALDDDFKQNANKRKKQLIKLKKTIQKIEKKASNVIEDEEKRAKAKEVSIALRDSIISIKNEYDKYNLTESPSLRKRKISEQDLLQIQEKGKDLRMKFFEVYTDTHFELIELTTEEEWDKIQKEINRIF